MKFSALASGSSGNCFYLEDENKTGILIDVGISSKKVCERLSSLGSSPEKINAIFLTHEHADHIHGIDVLARKFQIPIFATVKTFEDRFICSDENLINPIKNNGSFVMGNLEINAFKKSHKAGDPVSYSVFDSKTNKKISIITDVGYACENIIENVSDSDFLCLESNHDERMLKNGPYPYFLKEWIKSDIGHLSNRQSALCVLEHANKKLKHVVLSHLSETNNAPLLALTTFQGLLKERTDLRNVGLSVSGKNSPTGLFRI